jgi:hypothetical protein
VTPLEVRDIFTRCLILDDLLEPLYEGVALFAEQNLTSLQSEAASVPILLTGVHFGIGMSPSFFTQISELLTRSRRTITNIKRKAAILSGPGDPGEDPYLAGYMSVLACFYKARWRVELFRDPDFFISYFKTFMFDDLGFVECALKQDRSLLEFRDDVHEYLAQRLDDFFKMDHSVWAERVNQRFLQGVNRKSTVEGKRSETNGEVIPIEFFAIDNSESAVEKGRCELNSRVQALYKLADIKTDCPDPTLAGSISHVLAQIVSTRFSMRLASKKVWIVNFENGIGLAETQAEYTSLVAREGGRVIPLQLKDCVPDGPAILECAAEGEIPFFVLRALEEDKPGPVLATFGHLDPKTVPTPPHWSHAATTELASLSATILTPGVDGKYAREIQEMADLVVTSKQKRRLAYEPTMMFHHRHDQPLTTEFLTEGFRGVLLDRQLIKPLAALSILCLNSIPEELILLSQRSRWEWLVSVGEIKVDYDTAVTMLAERGRDAGWNLVQRINSEMAIVLPC